MCKVCRLWGVLSRALFSYACRPNFHHKYLTLTDPVLSVCEEPLISLHIFADRPKILKLETCMNVCLHVCVEKHMHECVHALMHMCACMNVSSNWGLTPRSDYSASSPFLLFQCFPAFLLVCRTTQFTAERNHLYWRVTHAVRGQTLLRLPSFFHSSISFLSSSVLGQTGKIKPIATWNWEINIYHLWYDVWNS